MMDRKTDRRESFPAAKFVIRGSRILIRPEDIEAFVQAMPQTTPDKEEKRETVMIEILAKITETTGVEYYFPSSSPSRKRVRPAVPEPGPAPKRAPRAPRPPAPARVFDAIPPAPAPAADPAPVPDPAPAPAAAQPKQGNPTDTQLRHMECQLNHTRAVMRLLEQINASRDITEDQKPALRAAALASLSIPSE